MPPRISALQRLGTTNLSLTTASKPIVPNFLPITQTATLTKLQKEKQRKAQQDPYRAAQALQRRNANLKRQEEIVAAKAAGWGDPIWGKPSSFIEAMDKLGEPGTEPPVVDRKLSEKDRSTPKILRNHFVTEDELNKAVEDAFALSKPMVGMVESQMDPTMEAERNEQHKQNHARAVEAIRRITSLENSSARDRFHIKVRTIVDELGRHKTDKVLKPRPASIHKRNDPVPMRAGPDTGSSEVQIGILTVKIRALASALQENRGYKDKHNRRNLRLLLHRRQKLLKYMERKERGGERWTNMLEKLGLTPATWQRQIEL